MAERCPDHDTRHLPDLIRAFPSTHSNICHPGQSGHITETRSMTPTRQDLADDATSSINPSASLMNNVADSGRSFRSTATQNMLGGDGRYMKSEAGTFSSSSSSASLFHPSALSPIGHHRSVAGHAAMAESSTRSSSPDRYDPLTAPRSVSLVARSLGFYKTSLPPSGKEDADLLSGDESDTSSHTPSFRLPSDFGVLPSSAQDALLTRNSALSVSSDDFNLSGAKADEPRMPSFLPSQSSRAPPSGLSMVSSSTQASTGASFQALLAVIAQTGAPAAPNPPLRSAPSQHSQHSQDSQLSHPSTDGRSYAATPLTPRGPRTSVYGSPAASSASLTALLRPPENEQSRDRSAAQSFHEGLALREVALASGRPGAGAGMSGLLQLSTPLPQVLSSATLPAAPLATSLNVPPSLSRDDTPADCAAPTQGTAPAPAAASDDASVSQLLQTLMARRSQICNMCGHCWLCVGAGSQPDTLTASFMQLISTSPSAPDTATAAAAGSLPGRRGEPAALPRADGVADGSSSRSRNAPAMSVLTAPQSAQNTSSSLPFPTLSDPSRLPRTDADASLIPVEQPLQQSVLPFPGSLGLLQRLDAARPSFALPVVSCTTTAAAATATSAASFGLPSLSQSLSGQIQGSQRLRMHLPPPVRFPGDVLAQQLPYPFSQTAPPATVPAAAPSLKNFAVPRTQSSLATLTPLPRVGAVSVPLPSARNPPPLAQPLPVFPSAPPLASSSFAAQLAVRAPLQPSSRATTLTTPVGDSRVLLTASPRAPPPPTLASALPEPQVPLLPASNVQRDTAELPMPTLLSALHHAAAVAQGQTMPAGREPHVQGQGQSPSEALGCLVLMQVLASNCAPDTHSHVANLVALCLPQAALAPSDADVALALKMLNRTKRGRSARELLVAAGVPLDVVADVETLRSNVVTVLGARSQLVSSRSRARLAEILHVDVERLTLDPDLDLFPQLTRLGVFVLDTRAANAFLAQCPLADGSVVQMAPTRAAVTATATVPVLTPTPVAAATSTALPSGVSRALGASAASGDAAQSQTQLIAEQVAAVVAARGTRSKRGRRTKAGVGEQASESPALSPRGARENVGDLSLAADEEDEDWREEGSGAVPMLLVKYHSRRFLASRFVDLTLVDRYHARHADWVVRRRTALGADDGDEKSERGKRNKWNRVETLVLFDAILFTRPDRGLSWPLIAQTFHWFLSGHGYMLCAQGAFRDALSHDPLSPLYCSHARPCVLDAPAPVPEDATPQMTLPRAAPTPLPVAGHSLDDILCCEECRARWCEERERARQSVADKGAVADADAGTAAERTLFERAVATDTNAVPLCARHAGTAQQPVHNLARLAAEGTVDVDALPLALPLTSPFSSPCLSTPSREDCLLMLEMIALARVRRNLEMDRRFQNLCTNARRQMATSRGTTSLTIHNALLARRKKATTDVQPEALLSCALNILGQSPYACADPAAPTAVPTHASAPAAAAAAASSSLPLPVCAAPSLHGLAPPPITAADAPAPAEAPSPAIPLAAAATAPVSSLAHPLTTSSLLAVAIASVLGLSFAHLPSLAAHLSAALWRYCAPVNLRNWRRLLTTIATEQRLKQLDGTSAELSATQRRKDRARVAAGTADSVALPTEPTDADVAGRCVPGLVSPAHTLMGALRDFHAHDATTPHLSAAATPALDWGYLALMVDAVVKDGDTAHRRAGWKTYHGCISSLQERVSRKRGPLKAALARKPTAVKRRKKRGGFRGRRFHEREVRDASGSESEEEEVGMPLESKEEDTTQLVRVGTGAPTARTASKHLIRGDLDRNIDRYRVVTTRAAEQDIAACKLEQCAAAMPTPFPTPSECAKVPLSLFSPFTPLCLHQEMVLHEYPVSEVPLVGETHLDADPARVAKLQQYQSTPIQPPAQAEERSGAFDVFPATMLYHRSYLADPLLVKPLYTASLNTRTDGWAGASDAEPVATDALRGSVLLGSQSGPVWPVGERSPSSPLPEYVLPTAILPFSIIRSSSTEVLDVAYAQYAASQLFLFKGVGAHNGSCYCECHVGMRCKDASTSATEPAEVTLPRARARAHSANASTSVCAECGCPCSVPPTAALKHAHLRAAVKVSDTYAAADTAVTTGSPAALVPSSSIVTQSPIMCVDLMPVATIQHALQAAKEDIYAATSAEAQSDLTKLEAPDTAASTSACSKIAVSTLLATGQARALAQAVSDGVVNSLPAAQYIDDCWTPLDSSRTQVEDPTHATPLKDEADGAANECAYLVYAHSSDQTVVPQPLLLDAATKLGRNGYLNHVLREMHSAATQVPSDTSVSAETAAASLSPSVEDPAPPTPVRGAASAREPSRIKALPHTFCQCLAPCSSPVNCVSEPLAARCRLLVGSVYVAVQLRQFRMATYMCEKLERLLKHTD